MFVAELAPELLDIIKRWTNKSENGAISQIIRGRDMKLNYKCTS
jgi:hypothetical protein